MSRPEAEPTDSAAPDPAPGGAPETAPAPAGDAFADLPPVESIGAGTDLGPWLRPGVPAALKTAALRRKWLSTPAIRDHVDPALDYAWDWNAAAAVPGAAGRIAGEALDKMLKSLTPEPAAAPAPEAPDAADAPVAAPARTGPAQAAAPAAPAAASKAPAAPPQGPAESAAPAPPRRRHGGALPRPPAPGPGAAD